MEPELFAVAERERQTRAAAHRRRAADALDRQYEAFPRLRELDNKLRSARIAAVAQGFLSPPEAGDPDAEAVAAERLAFIRSAGITPASDTPYCELCGDAGAREGAPCECLKALYAPLQRDVLKRDIDIDAICFGNFDIGLFRAEKLETERYAPRELIARARDAAAEFAENFGEHSESLFINGNVGTGKTFLAACILGAVANRAFWTEYIPAGRFIQAAEANQFSREQQDGRDFRRFARCDLLVLDDLGTEYLSPFAQSALFDLINTRLQRRKSTIVTSNLISAQLSERYLPQTASRLGGEFVPIYLFGDDLRERM
ncbi:MAG: ATP-binding protein [Oscillospiraceae bacterium]|jgi:DNA replication protein DnaC|nr:ATP-binding protein [Oscillospiraceae bacterium]